MEDSLSSVLRAGRLDKNNDSEAEQCIGRTTDNLFIGDVRCKDESEKTGQNYGSPLRDDHEARAKLKLRDSDENNFCANGENHSSISHGWDRSKTLNCQVLKHGKNESCQKHYAGQSAELENFRKKYEKLLKERNCFEEKIFEIQSEFCSMEIERDLEKENSRYLEEQLSSLNSALFLKDSELASLRKRYRLLNDSFQNSETLRERLEKDCTGMSRMIRELEESLEIPEDWVKSKGNTLEEKNERRNEECRDETRKLEGQALSTWEMAEKEKAAKQGLEKMMSSVEKERSLLLEEMEILRNENKKKGDEMRVLREKLHRANKENQTLVLQKQVAMEQLHDGEDVAGPCKNKGNLTKEIDLLHEENREEELYQQLAVMEKVEAENRSLKTTTNEFEGVSAKLKTLGFKKVEELVKDYPILKETKAFEESRIAKPESGLENSHVSRMVFNAENVAKGRSANWENSLNYSSVPRSEYVKLKLQLKALTEEINSLREASVARKRKQKVVGDCAQVERRSKLSESKIGKKWLKTIKDSVMAVAKEDDITAVSSDNVFLDNQLHEAQMCVAELKHDLEVSRKTMEVVVSANRRYEEVIEELKRRLVDFLESHQLQLAEMEANLGKVKKSLQDEIRRSEEKEANITSLEKQYKETCIKLEKHKQKFVLVYDEKERIMSDLETIKRDILRYFGDVSIQFISETLSTEKLKSLECVKTIEDRKRSFAKLEQELNSLQQVNALIREELSVTRVQMQQKEKDLSEMLLSQSVSSKNEAERFQVVANALEITKQKEKEMSEMYIKMKEEHKKSQDEVNALRTAMNETRALLWEKEMQCESANAIVDELQTTCEVYENEFEKSASTHKEYLLVGSIEDDTSVEDDAEDFSENDSDSTGENYREIQEVLQERMTMKVEHLRSRLQETLTALSSCQKLNWSLQGRLQSAELRELDYEKKLTNEIRDYQVDTVLLGFSEQKKKNDGSLPRSIATSEEGNNAKDHIQLSDGESIISSHHEEVIKHLRIENANSEGKLAEANEKITLLEEKLANLQAERPTINGVLFSGEQNETVFSCAIAQDQVHPYCSETCVGFSNLVQLKTSKSTERSHSNEATDNIKDVHVTTEKNLKKELDSMTAKYVNLRAAFEGCVRRLRALESEDDVNVLGTGMNTTIAVSRKASFLVPRKISPSFLEKNKSSYQGEECEISTITSGNQETLNLLRDQDAVVDQDSSLSKISCAFSGSNLDSNFLGNDRMVVELTLTEADMDRLEVSGDCEEHLQEIYELDNECCFLRNKINELEKLLSRTADETGRVKKLREVEESNNWCFVNDFDRKNQQVQECQLVVDELQQEKRIWKEDFLERGDHVTLLKEKLDSLEDEKKGLAKERDRALENLVALKNQIKELERKNVTLNEDITECGDKISFLEGKVNDLKGEKQDIRKEKEKKDAELSAHEMTILKLENKSEVFRDLLAKRDNEISLLQGKISRIAAEKEILEGDFLKQRLELSALKKNEEKLKKEKIALENDATRFENEISLLEANVNQLLKQKNCLETDVKPSEDLSATVTVMEDDIANHGKEMSIPKAKIIELEMEKDCLAKDLGKQNEELVNEIRSLKETILQRESENSFQENELFAFKSAAEKLWDERNVGTDDDVKRDLEVSSLKAKINQMDKENDLLLSERNEVLAFKTALKMLQEVKKGMEDEIAKQKAEISFLETKVVKLQDERNSLSTNKDHQSEKKAIEDKMAKDVDEISILRIKIVQLVEEREDLTNVRDFQSRELSKFKFDLERLEREKKAIEDQLAQSNDPAFSLKAKVVQRSRWFAMETLEGEKKAVEDELEKSKSEASCLKAKVVQLEKDKDVFSLERDKQDEELAQRTTPLEVLEGKKKAVVDDLAKSKSEASSPKEKIHRLEEENDYLWKKLSSHEIIKQGVENERKGIENELMKRNNEVFSLETKAVQLKEENYHLWAERDKQDRELTAIKAALETLERKNKEDEIVKSNVDPSLKAKITQLEDEKNYLLSHKYKQATELSAIKTTVETLQTEKKAVEVEKAANDKELSFLRMKMVQLEAERADRASEKSRLDRELSSSKTALECLVKEKKAIEEEISKKNDEITSLEAKVGQLKKEKYQLLAKRDEEDSELKAFKATSETIQGEKRDREKELGKSNIEISSLKAKITQLEDEKNYLLSHKDEQVREFSAIKTTVEALQTEKKAVEIENAENDKELSFLRMKMVQLEAERADCTSEKIRLDREVSSSKTALECLGNQKKAMEEEVSKKNDEITSLKANVERLEDEKVQLSAEKSKCNRELSLVATTLEMLQGEKEATEDDIAKKNDKISSLTVKVNELMDKKDCLLREKDKQRKELEAMESDMALSNNEISSLQAKVIHLESERRNLADIRLHQDQELSALKTAMERDENERKVVEDELVKSNSVISSLREKVSALESEKDDFLSERAKEEVELSTCHIALENVRSEKNVLELEVKAAEDELFSLKKVTNQQTETRKSLESEIQKRDEEILLLKVVLEDLQVEKKTLENDRAQVTEELSLVKGQLDSCENEISFLKNESRKFLIEKKNLDNMMREINDKTRCDEEHFEKVITDYLKEIESWKINVRTLEEDVTALRNESGRLRDEKLEFEKLIQDLRESKKEGEIHFQENIFVREKELDSWKSKYFDLESSRAVLRKKVEQLETECKLTRVEVQQMKEGKEQDRKHYEDVVRKLQEKMKISENVWEVEKEKLFENFKLEVDQKVDSIRFQYETKKSDFETLAQKQKQRESDLLKTLQERCEKITLLESTVKELESSKMNAAAVVQELQLKFADKESELKASEVVAEKLDEEKNKLIRAITVKEESTFKLESKVKELCQVRKEYDELSLTLDKKVKEYEWEITDLRNIVKSCESHELILKDKLKATEDEVERLISELSANERQRIQGETQELSLMHEIEKNREKLRVLLADIDETSKIKTSLENEIQCIRSTIEQKTEGKIKLESDIFSLREITDELTKGKLTLLEEIAKLGDQKKEFQEFLNSGTIQLAKRNHELENERDRLQDENAELVMQISSLKVTLATIQVDCELAEHATSDQKMRLEEKLRRENQDNSELEKNDVKLNTLQIAINSLEERLKAGNIENKALSLRLGESERRVQLVEKQYITEKGKNTALVKRLKQHEDEGNDILNSGKPSPQGNTLRKKLKEFRAKLSEEKKQREMHEFEIKNLKEKVGNLSQKEGKVEAQLQSDRKIFLELKTERDGLLLDIESVSKRKKKDMEGYVSMIEELEKELRMLKEKESKAVEEGQRNSAVSELKEEKKLLELKLTASNERCQKEITELRTSLESIQGRHSADLKRFEAKDSESQKEVLRLRKALVALEKEIEGQGREMDKLNRNLDAVTSDRERMEGILNEKTSEAMKWRKETLDDKAEIKFLRGALNILEKEGLASNSSEFFTEKAKMDES